MIVARQRALSAGPAADPAELMRLAEALITRFDLARQPADMDEAIAAGRCAQQTFAADHPDWTEVTHRLRQWVRGRYQLRVTEGDLDETIELTRLLIAVRPAAAPKAGPPRRWSRPRYAARCWRASATASASAGRPAPRMRSGRG